MCFTIYCVVMFECFVVGMCLCERICLTSHAFISFIVNVTQLISSWVMLMIMLSSSSFSSCASF